MNPIFIFQISKGVYRIDNALQFMLCQAHNGGFYVNPLGQLIWIDFNEAL
jgi:hypothetical protein